MYTTLRGETFPFFHHHLHEILNPRKKYWESQKFIPCGMDQQVDFLINIKKERDSYLKWTKLILKLNFTNSQFQNTMVHCAFSKKKNPWLFPGSNLVNARLYLAQKLKNLKDFISTKFNLCKFLDFGIKFCRDIISHFFSRETFPYEGFFSSLLSIEFLLFNFQKSK